MKLHLPKMLFVAVMATFAMPVMGAALTSDNIVTPVEGGASYLNVGMENATDTWTGDLTIGSTADSTGDVDNVGAFNDSWGWITPNGGKDNTTITSGLKVTGNITVQGSGKVVLGGQHKGAGSFLGLEATEKITVTGGSLTSTKIVAKDLEVSGGTVSTNTSNCTSGNGYAGGPKQSYIKNSLTISGGSLSFGYTANVQGIGGGGHRMTAFGSSSSFTMTQSGGTMKVYGDMDLRAGSTITQKDNAGIMSLRDTVYMGASGTTTFNQSGDSAKLVIGRLENTSKLYAQDIVFNQSGGGLIHLAYGSNFVAASTITLNQSGGGTINLGGGHNTNITGSLPSRGYALSDFENVNTTYIIEQTGSGAINVKSNAALTADTVDVGADATLNIAGTVDVVDEATLKGTTNVSATGALTGNSVKVEGSLNVEAGGQVNVSSFTVNSESKINNKGSITLGSGTGSTTAGALSVTTGGTLHAILDGTNAVLNIGDNSITEWTMTSDSTFGIGFTSEYFENLTLVVEDDIMKYMFTDVVVATGEVSTSQLTENFTLSGMNNTRWTLGDDTQWSQATKEGVTYTYISGSLTFDTSVEVKDGGTYDETLSDESDIKISLIISDKDATLTGNNTHTGGTTIDGTTDSDGVKVTLASGSALGNGSVITKGTTALSTADDTVANLPATIQNSGELTMSGNYSATAGSLTGDLSQSAAWFDVNGKEGSDGFYREGSTDAHLVVQNTGDGKLNVNALDDVTVTIDGTEYQLYSDGLAGGKLDYSTYYIKGEHEVAVSEIHAANDSDTDTTKVVLESEDGALTADSSIDVEATGGNIDVTNDATVSGTIADTDITSTGGTIAATVSGDSSITATGTTTISGANSYNGGTIVDAAELIAKQADSLGTGLVTLKNGATLDLSGAAVANAIRVEGCTLRGGSAYEGDMEVLNNLNLGGATTANKVTLSGNGTLTGGSMTTTTLDVQTSGDANLGTDLTIRDGGIIILNNGKVLNVSGSLTLAGSTTLELTGAYQVGDVLVNSEKALTMGSVELVYADDTVELERVGNSIILVSKFKQPIAEALTQGNWGIVTASRAFVNTVRGQRNNTGCITTGKGTVWVSVLGARNNLKGADVSVEGSVIGADMKVGKRSVLGIALGYTEGKVTPDNQSRITQDGYYAAIYGEHGLRQLSATSNLSFDWVAAYGTTENRQNGMYWEQDSVQVNARINWNKQLTSRVRFNAFAGLEYFASNSGDADGASSGSLQNLRGEVGVGASYVAMGTPASEDGKASYGGCEKLVLHGELRFMSDLVRNNPVVEMSGLRGEGYNPGRHGVGIEAGATYRINDRWTTSANYSFNAMEDSNEHRVNVGASYSF